MPVTLVAHAGWDELLVAALAVGIVLVLRTRAERRRRLEEQQQDVEEARSEGVPR